MPYTRLLNTGLGGYDHHASDLHQHSGVAQMRVLHSLRSQPNITMSMVNWILESCEDLIKQLKENGDMLQSDELSS